MSAGPAASDEASDKAAGGSRPKVVLLFGGPSRERLVSVASAQHVAAARQPDLLWFWAPDQTVFQVPLEALLDHRQPFEREFRPGGEPSWPTLQRALDTVVDEGPIFFLALHGSMGEDGTLQGWFEQRALRFTGSGARASADAFDKVRTKQIVAQVGLRVPDAITLEGKDRQASRDGLEAFFGRHRGVVLKPVAEGSSVGLFIIHDPSELARALAHLSQDREFSYLAEEFVAGRELTVGVVEQPSGELLALPCSEVRLDAGRSFDFAGKYLARGAVEITPAELPAELADAVQRCARDAHRAIGCVGYSRTDVIVDERGPVFIETNTLPGLTGASFIPQQLEAADISFGDFVAGQLELASKRG